MLPPKSRIQTYPEFWKFYLREHSKRATRKWHAAGTTFALALAAVSGISGHPLWIPLALLPAYGFAWYSHFFIEGNRPATIQYPLWSFVSDFRMLYWMALGKL